MLTLNKTNNTFSFSLLKNPLPRVLKFNKFQTLLSQMQGGHTVLDYGSGDRPYEELLLTKFSTYIAADYNVTNKKHTKEPDIFISQNGCVDIPSASIDCVILTEVLEHIYEPKLALQELHRVLKPNGVIIGTVPFVVAEHEQPYDFYRYSYFCLQKMFKETSFTPIAIEYVGDRIATTITILNSLLQLLVKLFRKLKLGLLAYLLNFLIKIPEYIYLYLHKSGIDFQKIQYLKSLPVGYLFYLRKKEN